MSVCSFYTQVCIHSSQLSQHSPSCSWHASSFAFRIQFVAYAWSAVCVLQTALDMTKSGINIEHESLQFWTLKQQHTTLLLHCSSCLLLHDTPASLMSHLNEPCAQRRPASRQSVANIPVSTAVDESNKTRRSSTGWGTLMWAFSKDDH